jgi:hypothetical protein
LSAFAALERTSPRTLSSLCEQNGPKLARCFASRSASTSPHTVLSSWLLFLNQYGHNNASHIGNGYNEEMERARASPANAAVECLRCQRTDRKLKDRACSKTLSLPKDRSQASQSKHGACAGESRTCCCRASSLPKVRSHTRGHSVKSVANIVLSARRR